MEQEKNGRHTPHDHEGESHAHGAHSHHHTHVISSLSKAFVFGTLLNLTFVVVEGIAGFMSNSVGLLSDAGHNLSDTVSLLLAWLAFHLAHKVSTKRFTYGYGRSTILASLFNAAILWVAIGMIVVESIRKFLHPQTVDGGLIIWVAAVGVCINLATALFFMKDRKKDLNIKGAFLHMAMDALVSVGVVVSGIVIQTTGWMWVDPIVGLLIAVIIFVSTWNLMKESLRLSLDAVPECLDVDEIEKELKQIPGIAGIHHIHIWALGTSKNAITVHVSVTDTAESEPIKKAIRKMLVRYDISHATIETEPQGYECGDDHCVNG